MLKITALIALSLKITSDYDPTHCPAGAPCVNAPVAPVPVQ